MAGGTVMKACFIRYHIEPFQREARRAHAQNRSRRRKPGELPARDRREIVLRDERTFVEVVAGTFGIPAQPPADSVAVCG